ncbi:MAG: hypothetical protein HQL34_08990 [Alphaproteobacteria bacterium]|nr:hypothetical protein [Alphaproteobacteria bacterium]
MTAVPPESMTADERLDEIAAILAAGVLRLDARRRAGREKANNIKDKRKFGLDFALDRSVHGEKTDPVGERK